MTISVGGFLAYGGALAVAAVIPGPGVTALVARSLGSGFRPAFLMLLGLVAGDLTWLTATGLGLALLAQQFGTLFLALKWFGVAYLMWIAWKFWNAGITLENVEARQGKKSAFSCFLGGLTLTLGNPKTMAFYLSIAPHAVDFRSITPAEFGGLVLLTAVILVLVLTPYIALVSRVRALLNTPRVLKHLSRGAAACIAGAAATIAARS